MSKNLLCIFIFHRGRAHLHFLYQLRQYANKDHGTAPQADLSRFTALCRHQSKNREQARLANIDNAIYRVHKKMYPWSSGKHSMPGNRQNSRLSQEELDFIKQVLEESQSDLAAAPGRAELDAPDQDPRMLELLQLANELRLQAEVGNYTLIFSPTIQHYPDTNTRQFQLGYPTIVEKTGHSRSRRITLSSRDIRLVDKSGRLKNLAIENISATGLALTTNTAEPKLIPGKTALTLSIKFPDQDWYECECSVMRLDKQDRNTRLALRFNKLDQQMYEQLNSYVYHNSPDIQSTYDEDDDRQV